MDRDRVVSHFVFINAPQRPPHLLVLRLVEAVGEAALAAVMAVKVACHEDAGAALIGGTLAPQPVDFSVLVDLQTVQTDSALRSHMMGCSYRSAAQTVRTL